MCVPGSRHHELGTVGLAIRSWEFSLSFTQTLESRHALESIIDHVQVHPIQF